MAKRIDVKGQIVDSGNGWIYDWLGIENTTPKKVASALKEMQGEEVEVYINSPGGSIFAGSEIYTELRAYAGRVKVKIVGIAASAASVIAQAGDESEISPTGLFMIHNVSTSASGDYREMDSTADALRAANQSIINAYVEKTGMNAQELQNLMDKETYFSAQQAVDYGFVDKIMFTENALSMTNSVSGISEQAIEKLRNLIGGPNHDDSDFLMQKNKAAARLKLLSMEGEKIYG